MNVRDFTERCRDFSVGTVVELLDMLRDRYADGEARMSDGDQRKVAACA